MKALHEPSFVIIGIGADHRGDDVAGLMVARALREFELPAFVSIRESSGSDLHELWKGADVVHMIDAVSAGSEPGTIFTLDLRRESLPANWAASSHAVGLPEAIELARALGTLPPVVILHAIQGESFEVGREICDAVRISMRKVMALIELEVLSFLTAASIG